MLYLEVEMNGKIAEKRSDVVNAEVLRWARERRGRTLEEVAQKLHKTPEEITNWEQNKSSPTVRQARVLADFYSRPFVEFLLPDPPQLRESPSIPDFRTHRGTANPGESWEVREVQEWAEAARLNALELIEDLDERPPRIPEALLASVNDDPEGVAARAREALEFPLGEQLRLTGDETRSLPTILRHRLERFGVLVLKRSELGRLRIRGVCIAMFPLPVIVFGNEAAAAQAFTLVHELGHILLRASGITGARDAGYRTKTVEGWCDRFAAAFLMPLEMLEIVLGRRPSTPHESIPDGDLDWLAGLFKVSQHAMLVRLVLSGYVAPAYYWEIKKSQFDAADRSYKGRGHSEYFGSRYRSRYGDLYTGLVLEAWSSGSISKHNASEYLGIKNPGHLDDIRARFNAT